MYIRNLLYEKDEKDVKMIVMKCCYLLTLVGVTLTDANSCAEDVEEWKDKKYPTDPRRAQQEFAQVHLSAAQMRSVLVMASTSMLVVAKPHPIALSLEGTALPLKNRRYAIHHLCLLP